MLCRDDPFIIHLVLNTIFQEWGKNAVHADSGHTLEVSDVLFLLYAVVASRGVDCLHLGSTLKKKKIGKRCLRTLRASCHFWQADCINKLGTHLFMGLFYCFYMCIWLPRRPLVSCPLNVENRNSYNHQCNLTCEQWPWTCWTCFLALFGNCW